MQESLVPSEQPSPQEQYSKAEMFEHLFPGNTHDDLRNINFKNLNILFKFYFSEFKSRKIRLLNAILKNAEFAERENIPTPDKLTIAYYISNLVKVSGASHPTLFQAHDFSDLVDSQKGEKLGGAAKRKISWSDSLLTKLELKWGGNPYFETEEILIGILDANNKPCGIIHFIEGKKPRKRKLKSTTRSRQALLGNSLFPDQA